MAKKLLIPIAFLLSVSVSRGASNFDSSTFPQLMTYNNLMRLTPSQRQEYISGVAKMMIDVEATLPDNDLASGSEFDALKGETAMMEMLFSPTIMQTMIPRAEAVDNHNRPDAVSVDAVGSTVYPAAAPVEDVVPEVNADNVWSCNSKSGLYTFDQYLGTCRYGAATHVNAACPTGTQTALISGKIFGTYKYCVPQSSWDRLSDARKAELVKPGGAHSLYNAIRESEIAGKSNQDLLTEIKGGTAKAASGTPAAAANPKLACVTNYQCQDFSKKERKGKYKEQVRAQLKAYYARDPASRTHDCINAGSMRQFGFFDEKEGETAHTKTRGRCQLNHEEMFGSVKLSCENPKETICEPLIFSVQKSDGKAFCVPSKHGATKACDDLSTPKTADPAFLTKAQGAPNAWDDYRNDFDHICRNSAKDDISRTFHCEECQVISDRLAKLNLRVANNSCGDLVDKFSSSSTTAPVGAPGAPAPAKGRQ